MLLPSGVVRRVAPQSLGERVGLRPGDRLIAVDGHPLRDAIDFRFYAAEERFWLTLRRDGRERELAVERRQGEDLGVEFESAIFDRVRTCNNNCFFCFLKGLPPGLRNTLYLKDDDFRLSFSQGNFVTLSNLSAVDWQRLEEQRLSPLNVSVHATEPELRRRMLGNRRAPDIVEQIRRLGSLGIRINAQVVLSPGLNDGERLTKTVDDLAELHPTVQSIAIVPVAASRHVEAGDDDKQWLAACTPDYARIVIRQVHRWQRDFRRRHGINLVYLADEFYLAADVPLPASSRYDGYPQFENGIGMTRSLIDDWRSVRRRLTKNGSGEPNHDRMTLACGQLIGPTLSQLAFEMAQLTGMKLEVTAVENRLFGARVTVSGLLAGADIIDALRGRDLGDIVVLPRHALDYAASLFLDDLTPDDVSKALNRPVGFASALSGLLTL